MGITIRLYNSNDFLFILNALTKNNTFLTRKNFSKISEGDYVSLLNVGAYGMSLSSNYNSRPTIAEILVHGSKHKIIRKRQSLDNLVNN